MDSALNRDEPNIVFIGGTGRSGTNISKALLANHPQVAALPFEYRFIIDPDGLVDFYRAFTAAWSPFLADRRLKRLERLLTGLAAEPPLHRLAGELLRRLNRDGRTLSPRQYHRWNLEAHLPNYRRHVQTLLARLTDFVFPAAWVGTESYAFRPQVYHAGPKPPSELARILGDFIRAVIGDLLAQEGKSFFVEDNTWNILFARELLDFVPSAKILHVYRDPRDVVASFLRQRWTPHDAAQAAQWYRDIITHWFAVRKTLPPESYFEYSLEALVNDTERVVHAICDFTGLPFHPALLQTDLSRSRQGRWRRDLSPAEQQTVRQILGEVIEVLGYE
ncbi:MAG: sulfotransferase [Caldilineae bacterium]|nr:MAG: sulfotransferase [Caldilineae bacterium]